MKPIKILFDKKGIIPEFMLDIWSYLTFVVFLFIFFILFKLQSISASENQLAGIADIQVSSSTLINYLRTSVIINGEYRKEISIAELIRLWHLEPDKYKDLLEKGTVDLLNKLEYEYPEPRTKSAVIRGFLITITKEKREDKSIEPLIEFKSNSFESGFCVKNKFGTCAILAEQFIPISDKLNLYIILKESYRAK